MMSKLNLKLHNTRVTISTLIFITVLFPCAHANSNKTGIFVGIENFQSYYELPELPFEYDALEPWIDNRTMEAHHSGVHGSHTIRLNGALHAWRKSGIQKELAMSSLIDILKNINKVPEKWRKAVRESGGGYTNHLFYFATLDSPDTSNSSFVPAALSSSITRSFHSFVAFKTWMTREALSMYGSGYIWLCRVPKENYLTVYPTSNQLSPLSLGLQPLLGLDLWEHAYYLKHQYKRKNYIENWWKVISWTKVQKLYDWWLSIEPRHDEL